jgi:hypothetical protein
MIPRGTYFGRPIGAQPKDEAEHFIRCPACNGWIDCRDLGQVLEHEGRCHIRLRTSRNDGRSVRDWNRRHASDLP